MESLESRELLAVIATVNKCVDDGSVGTLSYAFSQIRTGGNIQTIEFAAAPIDGTAGDGSWGYNPIQLNGVLDSANIKGTTKLELVAPAGAEVKIVAAENSRIYQSGKFAPNSATDGGFFAVKNIEFYGNGVVQGNGGAFAGSLSYRFTNCSFDNFSVTGLGGVVYSNNVGSTFVGEIYVRVDGCDFTNNTAARGGAIAIKNTSLLVDNTTRGTRFDSNTAERGGAIYIESPKAVLMPQHDGTTVMSSFTIGHHSWHQYKTIFENNTATTEDGSDGRGGAIFVYGGYNQDTNNYSNEINGAVFENNIADVAGGAIYNYFNRFTIYDSVFGNASLDEALGNFAPLGGAIYNYNRSGEMGECIIDDCDFFVNGKKYSGEVFDPTSGECIKVYDRTEYGGAIYNHGVVPLHVRGGYFEGNEAYSAGGAIFSSDGDLVINESCCERPTFIGNRVDGGEYGGSCDEGIAPTPETQDLGAGGAVYAYYTTMDVNNAIFQDNWAQKAGGAVYIYGGSSGQDNYYGEVRFPLQDGSGVREIEDDDDAYYYFHQNFSKTDFVGNWAIHGGGIMADYTRVSIDASNFTSNGACKNVGQGGAILLYEGSAAVQNTVFRDNRAYIGGAAYLWGEAAFAYCTITQNRAYNGNGSGVYVWDDAKLVESWCDRPQYKDGNYMVSFINSIVAGNEARENVDNAANPQPGFEEVDVVDLYGAQKVNDWNSLYGYVVTDPYTTAFPNLADPEDAMRTEDLFGEYLDSDSLLPLQSAAENGTIFAGLPEIKEIRLAYKQGKVTASPFGTDFDDRLYWPNYAPAYFFIGQNTNASVVWVEAGSQLASSTWFNFNGDPNWYAGAAMNFNLASQTITQNGYVTRTTDGTRISAVVGTRDTYTTMGGTEYDWKAGLGAFSDVATSGGVEGSGQQIGTEDCGCSQSNAIDAVFDEMDDDFFVF